MSDVSEGRLHEGALALDASRTLLYAGITPSTTMISDAGIISLSTATT